MPTRSIEKTFRFDAGHRALGFDYKKEETIHGHTWRLTVTIEATQELGERESIFDTNDLAVVVNSLIDQVDHSFIIWSLDPIYPGLKHLCKSAGIDDKIFPVDFNPTLEGLAKYFFEKISEGMQVGGVVVRRARLECATTLSATHERT
ncbi:6-pyruvoyl tetrahydropterin synthase family protein [Streptomyces sp. NPDC058701]|uniref:6-pyruvoyl trahydropterin synthase family protein n=1 Tax=Streptomyces sp. NPDC058701 TaxID=3346608 RepID=UPI00364CC525